MDLYFTATGRLPPLNCCRRHSKSSGSSRCTSGCPMASRHETQAGQTWSGGALAWALHSRLWTLQMLSRLSLHLMKMWRKRTRMNPRRNAKNCMWMREMAELKKWSFARSFKEATRLYPEPLSHVDVNALRRWVHSSLHFLLGGFIAVRLWNSFVGIKYEAPT
eukprot:5384103-Amphidinium_carterae.1